MLKELVQVYLRSPKLFWLMVTYICAITTITYLKGAIWGLFAPTAGILSVFGMDALRRRENGRTTLLCILGFSTLIILFAVYNFSPAELTVKVDDVRSIKVKKNMSLISEGAKIIKWPTAHPIGDVYFFGIHLPWIVVFSDHSLILKPTKNCVKTTDWSECCFKYTGTTGVTIIDLGKEYFVVMISINKSLHNPPKDFSLKGSLNFQIWFPLGNFTYDWTSKSNVQTFELKVPHLIRYLNLNIWSNWGDMDYTSLCAIKMYASDDEA